MKKYVTLKRKRRKQSDRANSYLKFAPNSVSVGLQGASGEWSKITGDPRKPSKGGLSKDNLFELCQLKLRAKVDSARGSHDDLKKRAESDRTVKQFLRTQLKDCLDKIGDAQVKKAQWRMDTVKLAALKSTVHKQVSELDNKIAEGRRKRNMAERDLTDKIQRIDQRIQILQEARTYMADKKSKTRSDQIKQLKKEKKLLIRHIRSMQSDMKKAQDDEAQAISQYNHLRSHLEALTNIDIDIASLPPPSPRAPSPGTSRSNRTRTRSRSSLSAPSDARALQHNPGSRDISPASSEMSLP